MTKLVYDKRETYYIKKAEKIGKKYKILKMEMRKKHGNLHYVLWLGTPEGKIITRNGKAEAITIDKRHKQAELMEVGKIISWNAGTVNNRLGYVYKVYNIDDKRA